MGKDVNTDNTEEKVPTKKQNKKAIVAIIIVSLILIAGIITLLVILLGKDNKNNSEKEEKETVNKSRIKSNGLEDFDIEFLKLENKEENKAYSPLSIKYALLMLKDGTNGESKKQLEALIGDYKSNKYTNSQHMTLANAMFINNNMKDKIKSDYAERLKAEYNAEVIYDSFESPTNINNWVKSKTFNLIDSALDEVSKDNPFVLINSLAIDMEWKNKFLEVTPPHTSYASYPHEKYSWVYDYSLKQSSFENVSSKVSGMEVIASVNNYDLVKTLGEENVRKTVGDALRKWVSENKEEAEYLQYISGTSKEGYATYDYCFTKSEIASNNLDAGVKKYLDAYIKEINENYQKNYQTTDFKVYNDDEVKAFSKDLKEYDGTSLEYVMVMPKNENLKTYIEKLDSDKLNKITDNLKDVKSENFKDGVVTEIKGIIPKFNFEYQLDILNDLKKLGIKDVFDKESADLSSLIDDEDAYIETISHKTVIELNQDGIKASAVTPMIGGFGAGESFDYFYDVPKEEIDITFDKPFIFLVRDKNTKEVWFTGTVYEPMLWDKDKTKEAQY